MLSPKVLRVSPPGTVRYAVKESMVVQGQKWLFSPWIVVGLLFGLAIGVYANSFPGAFFLDDVSIVQTNPLVVHPDLRTIFTTDYWGVEQNSGLYRPLTILTFALNRWLLGPEPWAFHIVNVLLHALITVLLFLTLESLGIARSLAWLAAGLFAVHPIHSEVVNEAVGRAELLVALFLFLGLWAARIQRPWATPVVLLSYAAALFSKEHAIVFLAVMPLFDAFFPPNSAINWRKRLPLYLLLLSVTALWLALRTWGVDRGAIPPPSHDPFFTPLALLPSSERVLVGLRLQFLYFGKLLFPWQLHGIYMEDDLLGPIGGFDPRWMVLTSAFLVLFVLVIVWGWKRRRVLSLALLLCAVTLVPTSNILFATGVTFAERLAYLPSAWFCLALSAAGSYLAGTKWRTFLGLCAFLYLGFLVGRTVVRNQDFQHPTRLWLADVQSNPRNAIAWKLLGDTQFHDGRVAEALQSYRAMVEVAPDFADGLISYSQALLEAGRPAEAIGYAARATTIDQGAFYPLAHLTLAQSYQELGQPGESLSHLMKLGKSCQTYDGYWATLGKDLEALGDYEGALKSYRTEKSVYMSAQSDVLWRIGDLLLKMDRPAEAEQAFREELGRREAAASWNRLGVSLALQRRYREAIDAFARAVNLKESSTEFRSNYERALLEAENTSSSAVHQ